MPMAGMVEAAPEPTEVWVDDDTCPATGSGTEADPYCKIQDGINTVAPGGTVHVAAGVYKETIDVTKDNLTIQSSSGNPEDTIIDADGANENVVDITNCSGVTISGFTIKGAKGLEGPPWPDFIYGLHMENVSDCSLSDSVITDIVTAGTSCSGIRLKNADDNEFASVTISNISNVKSEPYGGTAFGIFVGGAEDSVILSSNGNSFTSTTISGITTIIHQPVGIEVDYSSDNSFTETSISNLSSTEGRPKGINICHSNDNSFTATAISNLTSVSGGVQGIAIVQSPQANNSFSRTRISDLSSDGKSPTGIFITLSSSDNSFTDTEISSVATTDVETYAVGVMLLWSSSHNTFDSTTISNLAGPTTYGIRLHISDSNSFSGGSISGATCGVRATGSFTLNEIHFTHIVGNDYGVKNENESASANATNNWWGDASGPSGVGPGTGDAVSHNVDYDPWADRLLVLSGDGQTGTVGAPLANPFASQLKNSSGNSTAIKDVPVSWNITSTPPGATGQSLSDTDTTTDSNGQASSTLTLGDKVGTHTVTANVPGESTATFTATATAGSLDHIVVSPDTATITTGNTQAYSAEAFDQYDNNLGDVTDDTTFEIEAGAGGSWAANIYTSENAGTWTVTGTYGGKSDTATLTVSPAASHAVTLTADPINIPADGSSTSTITAIVKDQYGNNITNGTDVLFETDHGTFASDTVTKQTSDGVATATLTSESSAETVIATVTATANGVSDATAVFFIPEGGAEVEESKTETVCGSDTVLNTPTGGDVSIDATGCHTITVAKYEDIPCGTPTFQVTGDYWDVHLDNITGVNSLTIEFCPADEDRAIYYCDGSSWRRASNQSYSDGCIVVTITSSTFPSLSDLTGLPFASGIPYPPTPVGGEAYPVNKLAILMPWIALFAAIVAAAETMLRRRRAQS